MIGPGVLSASVDALLESSNRSYLNLRFNREHDRDGSEFFYRAATPVRSSNAAS